jgi:hypothetical protein
LDAGSYVLNTVQETKKEFHASIKCMPTTNPNRLHEAGIHSSFKDIKLEILDETPTILESMKFPNCTGIAIEPN